MPERVARKDDERLKLSRINFNCKQFIPRMLAQFLEFAFGVILSGHAGSPNSRTIGELLEYIVFRTRRGVPQGTRIQI